MTLSLEHGNDDIQIALDATGDAGTPCDNRYAHAPPRNALMVWLTSKRFA